MYLRITFEEIGMGDLFLFPPSCWFTFSVYLPCDPTTVLFCLSSPLSTFPHHQDCFVCVWFLLFCVIRLIGLQAGSHECTDFCPELFPISSTASFSCNFHENFAEMREKTESLTPLETRPRLSLYFLFFNRRKRHTRHNLP